MEGMPAKCRSAGEIRSHPNFPDQAAVSNQRTGVSQTGGTCRDELSQGKLPEIRASPIMWIYQKGNPGMGVVSLGFNPHQMTNHCFNVGFNPRVFVIGSVSEIPRPVSRGWSQSDGSDPWLLPRFVMGRDFSGEGFPIGVCLKRERWPRKLKPCMWVSGTQVGQGSLEDTCHCNHLRNIAVSTPK